MIKLDVIVFLIGIGAVIVGAVLIETAAGAWLFGLGCGALIVAPCITAADRADRRS